MSFRSIFAVVVGLAVLGLVVAIWRSVKAVPSVATQWAMPWCSPTTTTPTR